MLANLLSIANAVWSLGPQLAGTAIDGGSRAAQVEGARANYDRTVATYRQTVITAFQQVEDALAQQRILRAAGERAARRRSPPRATPSGWRSTSTAPAPCPTRR